MLDRIIRDVTDAYLDTIDPVNVPKPDEMRMDLYSAMNTYIQAHNRVYEELGKCKYMKELPVYTMAQILIRLYHASVIDRTGRGKRDGGSVAIYDDSEDSHNYGLYVTDEMSIRNIIRKYVVTYKENDMREVLRYLQETAPVKQINQDENLIPVNNGVFDFGNKVLMPFEPTMVFDAKSHVDYVANAQNTVIHNQNDGTDWDVESWVNDLSDNPEITELLWQVLGAVLRPYVKWKKSIFLYATSGNNGKGCLLELMRNLLGTGRYMTTAFEDLGKPFELENLANGCMAILSDESSVNAYTENCRVFKNLVVGDVINLNVKYRSHVEICFHGLTVFSVNELPHTGDKTRAMEHRLITIPMEKCFTGHDRKYIKADYLNRKEVLEYVMYKVLNMDFYEFSEPDVCKQLKTGYLIENDIIREFAEEILPQLAWDYVPKDFLFDLYKEYIKNNNPSAHPVGKGSFWKRFQQIVEDNHPEWKNHSSSYPTKNFCFDEEPLLEEYHMYEWQHSSGNPKLVNYQKIKSSMACITRAVLHIGRNPFADPDEDTEEDVPFRDEEAGADVPGTAPSDDEEE